MLKRLKQMIENLGYCEELTVEERNFETMNKLICPLCEAEGDLVVTAEGGMAQNVRCNACTATFWVGMGRAEHTGFDEQY